MLKWLFCPVSVATIIALTKLKTNLQRYPTKTAIDRHCWLATRESVGKDTLNDGNRKPESEDDDVLVDSESPPSAMPAPIIAPVTVNADGIGYR